VCIVLFLSFFLFFCSVWYVREWTRTVFQPSWFVAIDTHISMLNQKNPFLPIVYLWLIFLSTNNQGFWKKLHVYLFSFCHVYWAICLWFRGVYVNLIRFCSWQENVMWCVSLQFKIKGSISITLKKKLFFSLLSINWATKLCLYIFILFMNWKN